jgi:phage terminase large subunit
MIPAVDHAPPKRPIITKLPHKLGFLMELHRYKVAWGGRGGAKSQSFARALLNLGANQKLRILCARETQRSLRESVHRLLVDCVQELGLEDFYTWNDNGIYGANGTEFIFIGLASHTVISIKSYEGVDIVWVEEGQGVSKRSWDMLIPTIRATNSEIWVSFNPELDSDDTYKRFVVRRPPDSIVVKMTYADNPWFPK